MTEMRVSFVGDKLTKVSKTALNRAGNKNQFIREAIEFYVENRNKENFLDDMSKVENDLDSIKIILESMNAEIVNIRLDIASSNHRIYDLERKVSGNKVIEVVGNNDKESVEVNTRDSYIEENSIVSNKETGKEIDNYTANDIKDTIENSIESNVDEFSKYEEIDANYSFNTTGLTEEDIKSIQAIMNKSNKSESKNIDSSDDNKDDGKRNDEETIPDCFL